MYEYSGNEDFLKEQKNLCEQYNISFEQVMDFDKKILLLGKNIELEKLKELLPAYLNIARSFLYFQEIWNLSEDLTNNLSPKQRSLLRLLLYLTEVEGGYSETVQIICFLLVCNDHDLYDPIRKEFVANYKDLDKIDLSVKLKFLKKHGFQFLNNAVDRDFRNCIAHLSYDIKEDGTVVDDKTGKSIKDVDKKSDYLGCVGTIAQLALGQILELKNPIKQSSYHF
jgi:hypothetical protein